MTRVTCRLTARNWDQHRNPTLGHRVWATFYLLVDTSTGQTHLRIFTDDGSNDADSCKDVPFGGFVNTAPYFRGEIYPKTQIFAVWIGVYKPNWENIDSSHIIKASASISTKLCKTTEITK